MPKGTQPAALSSAERAPVIELTDISPSGNTVIEIDLTRIVPSPFEPQARRRAKFKENELQSLGQSIKLHTLAQPIVVRIINNAEKPFQIVFGERRWLASRLAGLKTVNCFVREYTDAQVIELQYEENHRRQKNDPLDDAYYFKFLKERENYSDDDLANRLATTAQNVRDKLKLNDLIEEAKEELSSEDLPLKHAYYLAKFPASTQREICRAQYAYKYHDREEKAVGFDEFKAEVEENIVRRLVNASFDTTDPRLHIKGLLCANCPDNSAAATHLFPEFATEARCLNKTCFELKTNTNLRLQREEIAARKTNSSDLPIEEAVNAVPLVTERKYTSERTPFQGKVLTNQELLDEPECEFSVLSLAVEGTRKGQKVYVCQNAQCPVHHPDQEFEDETMPLDADFEMRVARINRQKILKAASEWFDDRRTFWLFDDLVKNLIVELLMTHSSWGSDCLSPMRDWKNAPRSFNNRQRVEAFVYELDKAGQSRILFLLSTNSIVADELGLVKILKDYTNLDFFRLDAETRLELAPEAFKAQAREYLEAVKNGNLCAVPRIFGAKDFDDVAVISGEEN